MSLPKQTYPIFTTEIPTTKQKVKFRPFLVSEEKSLLIANETEDYQVMSDTLKEVLRNTIQDEIEVDNLSSVDIEYLFLQIRAKSVGEVVELRFMCDKETCTDYEKSSVIIPIDITTIDVSFSQDFDKNIKLTDTMGMIMKLPTLDSASHSLGNSPDDEIKIIASCIDMIYSGDESWVASETEFDELVTFIKGLTSKQFKMVEDFFNNLPEIYKDISWTCPVCKKQHKRKIKGLASFFL